MLHWMGSRPPIYIVGVEFLGMEIVFYTFWDVGQSMSSLEWIRERRDRMRRRIRLLVGREERRCVIGVRICAVIEAHVRVRAEVKLHQGVMVVCEFVIQVVLKIVLIYVK